MKEPFQEQELFISAAHVSAVNMDTQQDDTKTHNCQFICSRWAFVSMLIND